MAFQARGARPSEGEGEVAVELEPMTRRRMHHRAAPYGRVFPVWCFEIISLGALRLKVSRRCEALAAARFVEEALK